MSDAMVSLRAQAEKNADADVLRGMIGVAAQGMMELEVARLEHFTITLQHGTRHWGYAGRDQAFPPTTSG